CLEQYREKFISSRHIISEDAHDIFDVNDANEQNTESVFNISVTVVGIITMYPAHEVQDACKEEKRVHRPC
ncbi:hypothetical protein KY362_04915, partial [Candidatus Woesearchaeota archaeon]|nr:hypothetical protein [Candidatus Woesearchaeota archaeon]